MQGVEILTSAQIATEHAWNPTAFWITTIIIFFIFLIAGICVSFDEKNGIPFVIFTIVGVIMGSFFGFLLGGVFTIPTDYITQYKVTISDEVSMNEFYEHYEVIDQDGKIFTVREKNDE